jgi:lysyl-tRNA synthetase class 2
MNEKTNNQNPPLVDDADDLPEQLRIRRSKRATIIERGVEPYPVEVPRTKSIKAIRETHKDLAIDVATGIIESIAGRIIFKRDTGNFKFLEI